MATIPLSGGTVAMKRSLLVVSLLLLPLIGCSSEGEKFGPLPSDIAPLFGGGGGSTAPAPAPAQVPATGAAKMLQNPEGQLEQGAIEVVASNATEAMNRCLDAVAPLNDAQTIVTCLGCRMRTLTTGKYICTTQTEYVPLPGREP